MQALCQLDFNERAFAVICSLRSPSCALIFSVIHYGLKHKPRSRINSQQKDQQFIIYIKLFVRSFGNFIKCQKVENYNQTGINPLNCWLMLLKEIFLWALCNMNINFLQMKSEVVTVTKRSVFVTGMSKPPRILGRPIS